MGKNVLKKAAVVALSAATIMTFSFASVFADSNGVKSSSSPAAGTSASVYLTKQVQMPTGTTAPANDYTFKFTQDTDHSVATLAIPDKTVSFTGATTTGMSSTSDASSMLTTVSKQVDVLSGLTFTQEGLYTYTVTESAGTANSTLSQGINAYYGYDTATTYKLRLYVKKSGESYYVDQATVIKTADSTGALTESNDAKIDASVNGDANGNANGFVFSSNYLVIVGGADKSRVNTNLTYGFDFALGIKSSIVDNYKSATSTTVAYKIMIKYPEITAGSFSTKNNTDILRRNFEYNSSGGSGGGQFAYTNGVEQTFFINAGDTLRFERLPVGAQVTVTDIAASGKTTAYQYTVAGTAGELVKNDTVNTDQTFSTVFNSSGTATLLTGDTYKAGLFNVVEFTNTWADMSVTGVVVENMPFILMGIALAGAALLLIMRRRRREDEE